MKGTGAISTRLELWGYALAVDLLEVNDVYRFRLEYDLFN
jgi:hypothetical protein